MKRKRTAVVSLCLAIVVAVGVFAGGSKEANAVNFGLSGNPDTLDPQKTSGTLTFQTVRSVYDTLVEPDRSGDLVPALAEGWSVSPDSLTWTFLLRKGVTFHNGEPFTSRDVKATFQRLAAKETASPKASEFATITDIATPDDHTVVFRLSRPYAPLLSSMASGWGAILPASLIASGHDFASRPVGTGPFRFVEWLRDNRIVLEKNGAYWMKGHPKVDMVIFNVITEGAVQLQALLAGELDIIDTVSPDNLPILQADPKVTVQRDISSLVMVLAMNTSRASLSDVRVRRAVSHAIDKQRVLDIAYGGGRVVGTFMDHGDPFYRDFTALFPYDPARARALLREAGVGADVVLEMALPQNYEAHVLAGELYQQMLQAVGLTVKLRLVDWSTWLDEVFRGGKYDMTVIGHTGKLDPDGRLSGYGTDRTYVKWVNADAAALVERARFTVDPAARKAMYDSVLEVMAREVPHVYVGTSFRYLAMRATVSGFHMDAKLDTFDFRFVEKRK